MSENIIYTISPLCQFFFLCNGFLILLFVSDGFFLTKGILLDYDKNKQRRLRLAFSLSVVFYFLSV